LIFSLNDVLIAIVLLNNVCIKPELRTWLYFSFLIVIYIPTWAVVLKTFSFLMFISCSLVIHTTHHSFQGFFSEKMKTCDARTSLLISIIFLSYESKEPWLLLFIFFLKRWMSVLIVWMLWAIWPLFGPLSCRLRGEWRSSTTFYWHIWFRLSVLLENRRLISKSTVYFFFYLFLWFDFLPFLFIEFLLSFSLFIV
jgi:hypothetical protein